MKRCRWFLILGIVLQVISTLIIYKSPNAALIEIFYIFIVVVIIALSLTMGILVIVSGVRTKNRSKTLKISSIIVGCLTIVAVYFFLRYSRKLEYDINEFFVIEAFVVAGAFLSNIFGFLLTRD